MAFIQAVFFDVGETIVDETREYGTWADWLGVPPHTFSAVLGAVIARGGDYRETFQYFRPGFDLAVERERRAAVGQPEAFAEENVYPDARPCLAALREQGLRVGLAGEPDRPSGNDPAVAGLSGRFDRYLGCWGVEKPTAGFFDRVVVEAGCPAGAVLYVGDRLDNDIRPAQAAGMATALIRRGPWGYILHDPDIADRCLFRLQSLTELPDLVAKHNTDERQLASATRRDPGVPRGPVHQGNGATARDVRDLLHHAARGAPREGLFPALPA